MVETVGQKTEQQKIAKLFKAAYLTGAFFVLVINGLLFYRLVYAGRIFPGVVVDGIALGGLSQSAAQAKLGQLWDKVSKNGLPVSYQDKVILVTPVISSPTNPDLAYNLLSFDPAATAAQAMTVGRRGGWFKQLGEPLAVAVAPLAQPILPVLQIQKDKVLEFLRANFVGVEQVPQPAAWAVDEADTVTVVPEVPGSLIDIDKLIADWQTNLFAQPAKIVALNFKVIEPVLTQERLLTVLSQARQLLNSQTLIFTFAGEEIPVGPTVWHKWLGAWEESGQIRVGLRTSPNDNFWLKLAEKINQPAHEAKFMVIGGRVRVFQPSQIGQELDKEASLAAAEQALQQNPAPQVPLVVKVTQPTLTTSEANNFGIVEIIGIGKSSFVGSPKNRLHNIKVGAAVLNGVLIKPGEEFSLVKTLGTIDETTGYLPELVIKGNKTIPEYGGGLCQIGTTTFRAALASGLPILERRNHSYRVSYYEPAGTDATIYDPKPDFRFKNDTPGAILIQTKIQGDNLIFEFWGQSDGRQIVQTKPKIYNIVKPPATKFLETEDLPVGEKKCTEHAHDGADAEFIYTVTYPTGEVKQETFKSHYIPWREICLIGVPKGTLNQPTVSPAIPSEKLVQPITPDAASADTPAVVN